MMDGIEASDAQPTSSTVDTKVLLGRKPTSCNASSLGIAPPLFIGVLAGLLFGLLIALTGADPLCPTAIAPNVTTCEATPPPTAVVDLSKSTCGGNGIKFADAESCTCFACYTGDTCAELLDDSSCVLQLTSGTPFLFEDYWVEHPEAEITILPSDHVGYDRQHPRLERSIRALHDLVGNAVERDRHIVVGIGSTELISAALFALAADANGADTDDGDGGEPATVWAAPPFYAGYVEPASFYESRAFEWHGATDEPPVSGAAGCRRIELVTTPNNPDGHERTAALPGLAAAADDACDINVLADHAYFWPHFVGIDRPVAYSNSTVALFTLSKMTGHASSRIGWAITPSAAVAERMRTFLAVVALGVPREPQLRAAAILEHVVAHDGEIFGYARQRMLARWKRLEALFGRPAFRAAWRLEPRDPPKLDRFSGEVAYEPSPAYAWLLYLVATNVTAPAAMLKVGVAGRSGLGYGKDDRFIRLELLMRDVTFDAMMRKLERLML